MLKIVDARGICYEIENSPEARDKFLNRINQHRQCKTGSYRLEQKDGSCFLINDETDIIREVKLFSIRTVSRMFVVRKEAKVDYLARLCGRVSWFCSKTAEINKSEYKLMSTDSEINEECRLGDTAKILFAVAQKNKNWSIELQLDGVSRFIKINTNQPVMISQVIKGGSVIWDGQELAPFQRLDCLDMDASESQVCVAVTTRRNGKPEFLVKPTSDPLTTFYKCANKVLKEHQEKMMMNAVVFYSKKV